MKWLALTALTLTIYCNASQAPRDPVQERLIRAAGRLMIEADRFEVQMKARPPYAAVMPDATAFTRLSVEFHRVLYLKEDRRPYFDRLRQGWGRLQGRFMAVHEKVRDEKAAAAFRAVAYDMERVRVINGITP